MTTCRAFFDAVTLDNLAAPYNTANLKIFYPASYGDSPEERNSGVIPADSAKAPFPVVILMPGINVETAGYSWLARALTQQGFICITYQLIAEEMPGYISLTPGLDIASLKPENYGNRPSATALTAIINKLQALNSSGILAGKIDLQAIILGGHSAGGTTALLNANPEWFEGIRGVFSYAAHSGASTLLGWPEDTLLSLPSGVPTLIMGGTRDGCIANSAHRYGDNREAPSENAATDRVIRTFDESLSRDEGDSALVLFKGANHFSFVSPNDNTTGRPFIDLEASCDEQEFRQISSEIVVEFIQNSLRKSDKSLSLSLTNNYSKHALVYTMRLK